MNYQTRITASQPVAALADYLGLPVTAFVKNGKVQYSFPVEHNTCAGQLDMETILKRFHEGEQEISDAKSFAGSVFKVINLSVAARNKERVNR